MKVLVLGGDGYLGWPTAMHLSAAGHDVGVADNFLRRQMVMEVGSGSLTPVQTLHERVRAWRDLSGTELDLFVGNLVDAAFVEDIF
ncbi:MAG: NAD-dependent dehydratase, partial [Actinobacteria bacterium]|nr:NAD-dependent dehydratase [Actinomycetota bacterium]